MKLFTYIIGSALALSSTAFKSQSAKDIIAKNIEQTGGLTNWKQLNSIKLTGRLTLGIKETYPLTILQARPNLTRTIIKNEKKDITIEGYDGKKGYAMNYATGLLQEYKSYQPESFDSDFIDYENKGFEAKILGKETVEGHSTYKIELTKNINKNYYYFDVQNYMLIKEEKQDETFIYNDFKRVGNYIFPFKILVKTNKEEQEFIMTFNKIEVNPAFDKNTFRF